MKNQQKKVIILDKLSSPFIAQAIIILKEDAPEREGDIIKEAERIVAGFFPQKKKPHAIKKQGLFIGGVCVAIMLTAILFKIF